MIFKDISTDLMYYTYYNLIYSTNCSTLYFPLFFFLVDLTCSVQQSLQHLRLQQQLLLLFLIEDFRTITSRCKIMYNSTPSFVMNYRLKGSEIAAITIS